MDKVLVGTVPGGEKFFSVERDGRKMPVLNGKGEVEFWPPERHIHDRTAFARVLRALDKPETLKCVG